MPIIDWLSMTNQSIHAISFENVSEKCSPQSGVWRPRPQPWPYHPSLDFTNRLWWTSVHVLLCKNYYYITKSLNLAAYELKKNINGRMQTSFCFSLEKIFEIWPRRSKFKSSWCDMMHQDSSSKKYMYTRAQKCYPLISILKIKT